MNAVNGAARKTYGQEKPNHVFVILASALTLKKPDDLGVHQPQRVVIIEIVIEIIIEIIIHLNSIASSFWICFWRLAILFLRMTST